MSKRVKFPDDCLENTLSHQSPVTADNSVLVRQINAAAWNKLEETRETIHLNNSILDISGFSLSLVDTLDEVL